MNVITFLNQLVKFENLNNFNLEIFVELEAVNGSYGQFLNCLFFKLNQNVMAAFKRTKRLWMKSS